MSIVPPGTGVVQWFGGQDAAELVLNRPEQLNALDEEMVHRVHAALDGVLASSPRALLIRAAGRAFCAGRDIADAQPGVEDGGEVLSRVFNPLIQRVADLPVPTVAAVHGACLGVGLGLALACDVVIAADDAKLGSPFAKIGAVLDSGGHGALVQRLGAARALDLIYSGRLLSGREAADWGLVSRSVAAGELDSAARDCAQEIAHGPTLAFLESKRLVRRLVSETLTLPELLQAEAEAQSRASRTQDYLEGFTAFLDRRPPTFQGR